MPGNGPATTNAGGIGCDDGARYRARLRWGGCLNRSFSLDVRPVGATHAHVFGHLVATAFDYPPAIAPLASQTIGRPHWHHYLAFEGDTPIASGAMYIAGEAAWFGFAATDAAHRKRGAQQALILRRLEDAADAGCKWVSVETAEDTVTRDAPSFRNLCRLGFEIAYGRPNYLWVRAAAPIA